MFYVHPHFLDEEAELPTDEVTDLGSPGGAQQSPCASDSGAQAGPTPDPEAAKAARKDLTLSQSSLGSLVPLDRDEKDTAGRVSEQWQENESQSREELPAINHHEE